MAFFGGGEGRKEGEVFSSLLGSILVFVSGPGLSSVVLLVKIHSCRLGLRLHQS